MDMQKLYLLVPLAPLCGAVIAGLFCRVIPRWLAHTATILGVALAFVLSVIIFKDVIAGNTFNGTVYTWMTSGDYRFEVGFLIDTLTATMMLVVTFVSLMVHIYTMGYMRDDPGYNRFFSYISLFTFSMLMLVMANNFMQLFFGWEAVGLVSYLLIGFWYTRPTAIFANMKAFLVNRVGDFGFILGIGLVLAHFGSLDYAQVFKHAPDFTSTTINILGDAQWSLIEEMLPQKAKNAIRGTYAILGIAAIILGLALLIWPGATLKVAAIALGAYFVVSGVVRIVTAIVELGLPGGWRVLDILIGLMLSVGGVVMLKNAALSGATLAVLITMVVGLGWMLEGVMALVESWRMPSSAWAVIYALISIVAGCIMLFSPLASTGWLILFGGCALVALGIVAIVRAFTFGKVGKSGKKR